MYQVKIAVIGAPEVGKTSFIHRIRKSQFHGKDSRCVSDKSRNTANKTEAKNETATGSVANQHFSCRRDEKPSRPSSEVSRTRHNSSRLPDDLVGSQLKQKRLCPSSKCSFMFCPSTSSKRTPGQKLVDITFLDVPAFSRFPLNSFEEWEEDGAIGVRSADAFVLLYDVTSEKSFEYVQQIRNDIVESFSIQHCGSLSQSQKCTFSWTRSKPSQTLTSSNSLKKTQSEKNGSSLANKPETSSTSPVNQIEKNKEGNLAINKKGVQGLCTTTFMHAAAITATHPLMTEKNLAVFFKKPVMIVVGNKCDLCGFSEDPHCNQATDHDLCIQLQKSVHESEAFALEASHIARKCWKCNYFPCSVKHDWNVTPIVMEILQSLIEPRKQRQSHARKGIFKSCFR